MTAYYNENDEFAADWLRNLIAAGLIADGEVDTRSIVDVRPGDLAGFTQCHFFAGIGGWSYALRKAGWDDSRPAWTGSCPCQPFSLAGAQRGFADERHLWPIWRDLVAVVRPPVVFGEQVASATEWLGLVRGDLEEMGYAVGALPIQAASAGADHLRDRYWFVADAGLSEHEWQRVSSGPPGERSSDPERRDGCGIVSGFDLADAGSGRFSRSSQGQSEQPRRTETQRASNSSINVADTIGERGCCRDRERQDATHADAPGKTSWVVGFDGKRRPVKSGIRLLAHGVPNRVGLLRGFGNAIDHRPAKEFIAAYMSARASSQHPSQERN